MSKEIRHRELLDRLDKISHQLSEIVRVMHERPVGAFNQKPINMQRQEREESPYTQPQPNQTHFGEPVIDPSRAVRGLSQDVPKQHLLEQTIYPPPVTDTRAKDRAAE